jgi:AcrR family transcriptional regulator
MQYSRAPGDGEGDVHGQQRRRQDESPDGRVRRGAENRGRILDAVYELVREGELQPTAEQVAQRAGVGERTVFRHFEDMETLHAELNARLRREVQPILDEPQVTGDRGERVRELVSRRARLFESIAPFHRSGALQRHRSAFLRRAHADTCRLLREDLARTLAPELAGDDGWLLEALDLTASMEAWDRLRSEQKLGRDRAARVLEAALLALLGDAS